MDFTITTVFNDSHKRHVIEMSGDLASVRTYLKLRIEAKNFNWGVIERTDEMVSGDISRWMIKTTGTYNRESDSYDVSLILNVFSIHDADPIINVNAMLGAMTCRDSTQRKYQPINKLLGGGKF